LLEEKKNKKFKTLVKVLDEDLTEDTKKKVGLSLLKLTAPELEGKFGEITSLRFIEII